MFLGGVEKQREFSKNFEFGLPERQRLKPQRENTCPGRAPAALPASQTHSPFTKTFSTPSESFCGSAQQKANSKQENAITGERMRDCLASSIAEGKHLPAQP